MTDPKEPSVLDEIEYKFGDNPKYYLEHAFRHLEVLCGQYEHNEITNQEFHEYRNQLKEQYLAEAKSEILKHYISKQEVEEALKNEPLGDMTQGIVDLADVRNEHKAEIRKRLGIG